MANIQTAPQPNPSSTSYTMASLYVGDLHPEVSESILFEKFSAAGPVLSIRVCRDSATRLSLGYAYVNFQQPADAERAMDTMNFEALHGKPMRIMWSQRDPAMRRSGAGNIFIKNLDKVIDNKSIYDTFSLFGNILSCKVAIDDEGVSKGYGFVHFETEEAALQAISKVNGMLLAGKKVFVGKFQPRSQRLRELGETAKRFNNVFVKNFGDHLDEAKLRELFSQFGTITSCAVMTGADGKPKGFGFVAFAEPEDAQKAVAAMNESTLEGTDQTLYVGRAQKKSERSAELKKRYELQKVERLAKYHGVNLYVKNLDENVDDEGLKKHFESFGNITSAKVMTDENGRSKGFGFVCFEKRNDAATAVTEMNSKMVASKPLYVALAQRKEDRRAELASHYMTRLANMRMHSAGPGNGVYNPQGNPGFYVANQMQQQRTVFTGQNATRGGTRWAAQSSYPLQQGQFLVQGAPTGYQANRFRQPQQQQQQQPGGRGPQQPAYSQAVQGAARIQQQQQRGGNVGIQSQNVQRQQGPPRHSQPGQKAAPQAYNQHQRPQGIVVGGEEPLTAQMLAAAAPQEQKQLLGERIYALIESLHPQHEFAGKITGMMLEIDNAELIMMLQDKELFQSKFNEAAQVLQNVPK